MDPNQQHDPGAESAVEVVDLACAVCSGPTRPSEAPTYRSCLDCGARTSAVPPPAAVADGSETVDARRRRSEQAAAQVGHLRRLLEVAGAPEALTPARWRVLELGCGEGHFLDEAVAAGYDAVGIDPDQRALDVGRARGLGARAHLGSAEEELPGDLSGPFDAVVAWELIEHVDAPVALLTQAARWLRPGGWIVGSTPNGDSSWASLLGANWHGHHVPERHRVYLTPRAFEAAAERAGLECATTSTTTETGGAFLLKNVATAAAERLAGTRSYLVRAGLAAGLAVPEWLAERSVGLLPGLRGDTLLFAARKPA